MKGSFVGFLVGLGRSDCIVFLSWCTFRVTSSVFGWSIGLMKSPGRWSVEPYMSGQNKNAACSNPVRVTNVADLVISEFPFSPKYKILVSRTCTLDSLLARFMLINCLWLDGVRPIIIINKKGPNQFTSQYGFFRPVASYFFTVNHSDTLPWYSLLMKLISSSRVFVYCVLTCLSLFMAKLCRLSKFLWLDFA